MIEIRKGTADDLEGVIQLLRQVKEAMDNPQWFYLDSPEEVREMFADGTMDLWVAVDGERLAGAFDALYPGLQSFNYGYAVGMAQEDLLKVVNMDTAAVHPDYRGQGLQRRLMACAEKELASGGEHILMCTVHPDNCYSLQNVLSQGYQIVSTRPMYGSVRHVLKKILK